MQRLVIEIFLLRSHRYVVRRCAIETGSSCESINRNGDKADDPEADEQQNRVEERFGIAEKGDVDEVVGITAGDCAADEAVENVDDRGDEPVNGLAPSQCAFGDEEEPEEDIQDWRDVVQRDIKDKAKAGGVPDASEQKRIR